MRNPRFRLLSLACAGAIAGTSQAANPAYQDFLFQVCGAGAVAALADRCAQTAGGLGNVSGDSETSLNPSQNLGHNQSPLATAAGRGQQARERGDSTRDAEAAKVELGPFSLLAHVNQSDFERSAAGELERGFEGDSRAVEAGFDYRLSERTVLGLIAGYSRTEYEFFADAEGVNFAPPTRAGQSEGDTVSLTAYASWAFEHGGYLDFALGFDQGNRTLRRTPVFQESTRTIPQINALLEGEVDGDSQWISLGAGREFTRDAFSAGLYGGVTWGKSRLDAYEERDLNSSGLAMRFAASERETLLGHVGLRSSYTFSTAHGIVVPHLRVEYSHDFEDALSTVGASFVLDSAGTVLQLAGAPRDEDQFEVGAGVMGVFSNGWQPFLDVDLLLGNDALDRTRITLGVRVEL